MRIRVAVTSDIEKLHRIRMAVKENVLNNPSLVTTDDYINYLTDSGKGWVCEIDEMITGFAIIDSIRNHIWALFVDPAYEGIGIGKRLQAVMLGWHFGQRMNSLWLTTSPGTRAEKFYRNTGWVETGRDHNGEIIFEMKESDWINIITRYQ